jgi:hypothetical protein
VLTSGHGIEVAGISSLFGFMKIDPAPVAVAPRKFKNQPVKIFQSAPSLGRIGSISRRELSRSGVLMWLASDGLIARVGEGEHF